MKRLIDNVLNQWKDSRIRQPLLVRGARQVGKTYSIEAFGKKEFENIVTLNFEEQPELKNCFSDFNPKAIIDRISILKNSEIKPGKTLVFFDEIQECPNAVMSLRYFYEKMPDVHVIGAGSLVEFTLQSENFKMPVGRVQSIFMRPLSFEEFLSSLEEKRLKEMLDRAELQTGIEKVYQKKLEDLLRKYFLIGGMPKIISAFRDNVSILEIQRLQAGLFRSYADDFAKYSTSAKHKYLRDVYTSAPRMIGLRYKYSRVNPDIESKFLKNAFGLLCLARCLTKVSHASGAGMPLGAIINEKKFKLIFLDVGLMQNALGIQSSFILEKSLLQINAGSVAEQFAGQELLSIGDAYEDKQLYFWAREKKGSNAEIDYLIEVDGKPFPVEVKAGTTGSLKSMRLFLETNPDTPFGIRYSIHELSFYDKILSIPLYMISQTKRLVRSIVRN